MTHPFIKRFMISLCAISALLATFVTAFLHLTDELFISANSSIETNKDVLWGAKFEQASAAYKLRRINHVKPNVIVIGSSRANQVREQFYPGTIFYNASLAVTRIDHIKPFLEAVSLGKAPKVVLISTDLWWFRKSDKNDRNGDVVQKTPPLKLEFKFSDRLATMIDSGFRPRFLSELLRGGIGGNVDPIEGRTAVGYLARTHGSGFRPDGSRQRGEFIRGTDPYRDIHGYGPRHGFKYYSRSAAEGWGRFDPQAGFNVSAASHLETALEYARQNKITIVLYTPAFAPPVMRALLSNEELAAFESQVTNSIQKVAKRMGAYYFNFHNPATMNLPDEWFFDGLHPTEYANLQMHRKIVTSVPELVALVQHNKIPKTTTDDQDISVFDRIAR